MYEYTMQLYLLYLLRVIKMPDYRLPKSRIRKKKNIFWYKGLRNLPNELSVNMDDGLEEKRNCATIYRIDDKVGG